MAASCRCQGAEIGMRAIVVAIVAIQIGLGHPARAEDPLASDRPLSETLPLFGKNHCADFKDPADQLFAVTRNSPTPARG